MIKQFFCFVNSFYVKKSVPLKRYGKNLFNAADKLTVEFNAFEIILHGKSLVSTVYGTEKLVVEAEGSEAVNLTADRRKVP